MAVRVAVANTLRPTGVAFTWVTSISVPTVLCPGSSAGATAWRAAFSIRATMAGVAKTATLPDP